MTPKLTPTRRELATIGRKSRPLSACSQTNSPSPTHPQHRPPRRPAQQQSRTWRSSRSAAAGRWHRCVQEDRPKRLDHATSRKNLSTRHENARLSHFGITSGIGAISLTRRKPAWQGDRAGADRPPGLLLTGIGWLMAGYYVLGFQAFRISRCTQLFKSCSWPWAQLDVSSDLLLQMPALWRNTRDVHKRAERGSRCRRTRKAQSLPDPTKVS